MQRENSITEPSSATVIPESQLFTFNSNSSSMSSDGNKNKRRKGNPSNADESSVLIFTNIAFNITEKKKTKSWSKDNVTPNSKSSETILLEWLLEPGNYQRYRGTGGNTAKNSKTQGSKGNSKDTRKVILTEIVRELHSHGLTHRTAHHVSCKLNEWITNFNKANDLIGETGGGGPYGDGAIDNDENGADEDKTGM
ncbi:hypothetical protein BDB00DRAFT_792069 [Zychaea mexicana]|uniref:uncharacterized protein n=1 Tax=Zychaea mexicana TaxID=64656 RepID=UPI0022FE2748|nr:uncharacterized protein BDB00DRAFT_792069 [Zychaea mexicana]KAI9488160.1 hypothetical protein BDB00DRAFT_792069 [Zychaea mexicana]